MKRYLFINWHGIYQTELITKEHIKKRQAMGIYRLIDTMNGKEYDPVSGNWLDIKERKI